MELWNYKLKRMETPIWHIWIRSWIKYTIMATYHLASKSSGPRNNQARKTCDRRRKRVAIAMRERRHGKLTLIKTLYKSYW